ncbi:hypothetical protein [Streptomyces jumonjinensis]|uniref:hypothetical protein n=1 Tax=Streptomyces jumonjinensis TaxID=1945 RepID=UPI00379BC4E6
MTAALTGTAATVIVYACEPDAAASIAAADSLARAVRARGLTVRAAVADTAPRSGVLDGRRGWAAIKRLLENGGGPLVVCSRAYLAGTARGCGRHLHRPAPRLQSPEEGEIGGQGMRLVAALTSRWGYTRFLSRPGKSVWMNVQHRGAPAVAAVP